MFVDQTSAYVGWGLSEQTFYNGWFKLSFSFYLAPESLNSRSKNVAWFLLKKKKKKDTT